MIPRALGVATFATLLIAATAAAAPAKMNLPPTVDIAKVTCSDLTDANELDRAATVMFYWGYEAAKANVTTFKTEQVRTETGKLITYCKSNPSKTIFGAMKTLNLKAF